MTNNSSEYLEDCYRNFSMYVLQTRAFPSLADGLKFGGRRLLWTAKNGSKYKTATLAGLTMPLHPHGEASDTIDTLTKPNCNNIPWFQGEGAFGTRLKPNASGAARYTSVTISDFTKDAVFADIELLPMIDNYDGTLKEPEHFLPLVPMVLVNPSEGIGVGFACNILPRSLGDIIDSQIAYLKGKSFKEPNPTFVPFKAIATHSEVIKSGNTRWWFEGEMLRINTSTVSVTNLPYGLEHSQFIDHLIQLMENDVIVSYEDHSVSSIVIDIKFPRGTLRNLTDDQIIKTLKLRASIVENLNVVDLTGQRVQSMDYTSVITTFCDWRLEWYIKRYELLKEQTEKDIQRYRDIVTAIKNNVGSKGRSLANRKELLAWLKGLKIVYCDYIADLPIYRLTVEEANKAKERLDAALKLLAEYELLLKDPNARKEVYIQELTNIKKKYHVPVKIHKPVKSKSLEKPHS